MAEFSVNVVTTAGLALIARAAAASQLIYTRVLSDADAMTAAAAALATPADFSGPEGTILAASATDVSCRVVGRIGNQSTAAAVKTFAVCAKIDGDANDVVVAVLSDDAEIPIPDTSSPVTGVEIGFLLNIASADTVTVQVTGAGSVTFGDIARFVSCHKAGDPTTGEDQTILGDKTFSGDCIFEQGATFSDEIGCTTITTSGSVEIGDAIVCNGKLTTGDDAAFGGDVMLSGSSVPAGEECILRASQATAGSTTTDMLMILWPSGYAADETLIELASDKVIVDGALEANSLYVATSVYIYTTLTVEGVATFTDPIVVAASSQIKCVDGSQKVRVQVTSYGVSVKNASETELAAIDTTAGNITTSGTVSAAGVSVGASGITGTAASRDNDDNLVIPIGGLVLAYVPKQSSASTVYAGEVIQTTSFNPAIRVGYLRDDGSLTAGGVPDQMGYVDSVLPAGKYACLSTIQVSTTQGCLALLQRVE